MKNNTVERTETIENLTPHVKSGSQKLVYILLTFGGLGAIGIGAYIRFLENHPWAPEILIAGGVAVSAPGILSFLYRTFMLDEIKLEIQKPANEFKDTAEKMIGEATKSVVDSYRNEISLLTSCNDAGLVNIFNTRQSGIRNFVPYIEEEPHEITIVGSSLRGLLMNTNEEYEFARQCFKRKILEQPKLKIYFLFTHPLVADLRSDQEHRRRKDIGKEIIKSLDYLISEWNIDPENIKLYAGTPTCFGIKTSNAMLLNPYPYEKEAFASPCFLIKKGGYIFTHFEQSHFNAWNSEMAKPLKGKTQYLLANLDLYANQIDKLYELDNDVK